MSLMLHSVDWIQHSGQMDETSNCCSVFVIFFVFTMNWKRDARCYHTYQWSSQRYFLYYTFFILWKSEQRTKRMIRNNNSPLRILISVCKKKKSSKRIKTDWSTFRLCCGMMKFIFHEKNSSSGLQNRIRSGRSVRQHREWLQCEQL